MASAGAAAGAGAASGVDALEAALLAATGGDSATVSSIEFARAMGVDHQEVVGVMNSLHTDGYVEKRDEKVDVIALTDEGKGYVTSGSPEYQVAKAVVDAGGEIAQKALLDSLASTLGRSANAGFGKAKGAKWIELASGTVKCAALPAEDTVAVLLGKVAAGEEVGAKQLKDLQKRKLLTQSKMTKWVITKGPKWAVQRVRQAAELTKEMLDSGKWATTEFKPPNFSALGKEAGGGHLHPLLKVRAELRAILLEMGFSEMPTAKFVESSFWNFDSLFQPQSHPARDAHDTFFIKTPAEASHFPPAYLERVKATHETGGDTGSIGYGNVWKVEEARKNILRTHTTAVSSQMLYMLANDPDGFKPVKYFSIDRVFRNEALDATHLAEFHQVEGFVADRGLSLGDLIGTISEFFRRMGITDLRFKPAYNPYTEPSMEVFGYHPTLKKWTEIGNSGVFRPEMLLPMGLPPDVNVIAWGLSLERPTMIKYGIGNIRDLFGHKIDLRTTASNPLARYDKVGRPLESAGRGAPVGATDIRE